MNNKNTKKSLTLRFMLASALLAAAASAFLMNNDETEEYNGFDTPDENAHLLPTPEALPSPKYYSTKDFLALHDLEHIDTEGISDNKARFIPNSRSNILNYFYKQDLSAGESFTEYLVGIGVPIKYLSHKYNAIVVHTDAPLNTLNHYENIECHIIMPEKLDAKGFFSNSLGIGKDKIDNLPITDEELFAFVVLHELRHCNSANQVIAVSNLHEIDADLVSIKRASKAFNNPELKNVLLNYRAISTILPIPDNHDSTLVLDAQFNGESYDRRKALTINQIVSSYLGAFRAEFLLNNFLADIDSLAEQMGNDPLLFNTYAFKEILKEHGNTMDPEVKKRMDLYIEAAEYFAPTAVKNYTGPVIRPMDNLPIMDLFPSQ
jgi:hypothetical protein